MTNKYADLKSLLLCAMICLTAYLCVRDCNKRILAEVAMERGIITGVKK